MLNDEIEKEKIKHKKRLKKAIVSQKRPKIARVSPSYPRVRL
jgi:hypothetical protein